MYLYMGDTLFSKRKYFPQMTIYRYHLFSVNFAADSLLFTSFFQQVNFTFFFFPHTLIPFTERVDKYETNNQPLYFTLHTLLFSNTDNDFMSKFHPPFCKKN